MVYLSLLLPLCDCLLMMVVFVLLAKPKFFMWFLVKMWGVEYEWKMGMLSREEEKKILSIASFLGWLGLPIVFLWSFCCGLLLGVFPQQ